MVCSHCGSSGHNKRTCTFECFGWPTASCEAVNESKTSDSASRSERRAAKALAALLPPPNKSKKVSKPLDGLAGCQNIWKEPKTFYVAKKVSKPLEDISACQNMWKEPKDFYMKQKSRVNTCSHCGGKGHNSRTCLLSPPTVIPSPTPGKKQKKCGICGEFGHNSRTCILKLPEKKQKKCRICGEFGHNSRTCDMKCRPCSDQVARSYCFAGMTAAQAVKMTKILECGSIYGETEEYPQFVESPPAQRKTECITFGNGETISLDLGTV